MTANRGLFVRNIGTTGTTPIEGRLVMASMVAENSLGNPRNGLLDQRATTVVSGTASMTYSVAACNVVVNRAAGEGVYMFSLTGTTTVATTAAPGTGSRWDLIYVKQNDPDKGDAANTAVLAVLQGTSSTGTPTKPYASLPAGAYVLAEAQVSAGAVATNGGSVTISQVWRYTALRGSAIPVRNTTERGEITATSGLTVRRLDLGPTAIETYTGSVWKLSGVPQRAEFTGPSLGYPNDSSQWGVGTLTVDPSAIKTMNNTFVQAGASDTVKILEPGLYLFEWNLFTTSLPPDGEMGMKNVTTGEQFANDDLKRTKTWVPALSGSIYANTNDIIQFYTFNRTGAFTGSNRIKITKLA